MPDHRPRSVAAQPFIIRDEPRAGLYPLGAPRISNASDARFALHTAPLYSLNDYLDLAQAREIGIQPLPDERP
jgi:hypothetical protein